MPGPMGMRPTAPHATPDNLNSLLGICLALKDVRDVLADVGKYDTLLDRLGKLKSETDAAAAALADAKAEFEADKAQTMAEQAEGWKKLEADQKKAIADAATAYSQMADAQNLVIQGNKALDDAKAIQEVVRQKRDKLDRERAELEQDRDAYRRDVEKLNGDRNDYAAAKADFDKKIAAAAALRSALD